jgi:hypothetical protein
VWEHSRVQRSLHPTSSNPHRVPPWPDPKLAAPLEPTRILPAARLHPPHGPGLPPPLRTPIVPPPLVLPQIDHFPSHRSPSAAAFLQLQPQAPLLPPVDIASPLEGWVTPRAGGYDSVEGSVPPGPRDAVERVPPVSFMEGPVPPGPPPTAAASRRSPCAAATPPRASARAQRLDYARLLALSKSDTVLGDLPSRPYLPRPFQARPYWLLSRPHLPSEGRLPPRPGGGCEPAQTASAWRQPSFACRAPCPLCSRRRGRRQAENRNPSPSR